MRVKRRGSCTSHADTGLHSSAAIWHMCNAIFLCKCERINRSCREGAMFYFPFLAFFPRAVIYCVLRRCCVACKRDF